MANTRHFFAHDNNTKGQLISKCHFDVWNFPKKQQNNFDIQHQLEHFLYQMNRTLVKDHFGNGRDTLGILRNVGAV